MADTKNDAVGMNDDAIEMRSISWFHRGVDVLGSAVLECRQLWKPVRRAADVCIDLDRAPRWLPRTSTYENVTKTNRRVVIIESLVPSIFAYPLREIYSARL